MSTDPPSSAPHKKPTSSTSSSSSSEDRQKQSRTSATSSSHMDFYGSSSFDWDVPYLSSIPTSILLNNQYQHSVTVSPHQLHTPHTHQHYQHYQHLSPFSLHHQPPSSVHFPFSPPPAPPVYPTSIPPHLTTLNHTQSPLPVHTPSVRFHAQPPPVYEPLVPAPAPTPYGGKEKIQFAPQLLTGAENALLMNSGSGSCRGASSSSSEGGDRKGKGKAVDRGSTTGSNGTIGKKRKRESSEAGGDGGEGKRQAGKRKSGVDGGEGGGGEESTQKSPSSQTDKKNTGRKRNNKIDIACNNCRCESFNFTFSLIPVSD